MKPSPERNDDIALSWPNAYVAITSYDPNRCTLDTHSLTHDTNITSFFVLMRTWCPNSCNSFKNSTHYDWNTGLLLFHPRLADQVVDLARQRKRLDVWVPGLHHASELNLGTIARVRVESIDEVILGLVV